MLNYIESYAILMNTITPHESGVATIGHIATHPNLIF